jgi:hypothetical protein
MRICWKDEHCIYMQQFHIAVYLKRQVHLVIQINIRNRTWTWKIYICSLQRKRMSSAFPGYAFDDQTGTWMCAPGYAGEAAGGPSIKLSIWGGP